MMYAARDTRREGMLIGGTNRKKTVRYELDVTARDDVVRQLTLCRSITKITISVYTVITWPCEKFTYVHCIHMARIRFLLHIVLVV